MNFNRALVTVAALACSPPSWAGSPTLTELGRLIPGIGTPGRGGFAIGDFDRDGRDDIVVPGSSGTAHFQVIGQGPGGIVSKQAVFLPDARLRRVMAVPIAGVPHLVTVSSEGVVRRFSGWPMTQAHSFELGDGGVSAAAIGDIDNNGAMDLVVSPAWGFSRLRAYALATGEMRWSVDNLDASDILLAQLDGDPALEIVLARTPGLVIDGATQATDWSYPDGFGLHLAGGRFQAGGGAQFVIGRSWDMLMTFQSSPWSPMWQVKFGDISRVAAADLDDDGFDDILEGDGQWGAINVVDEQTHEIRLSIEHDGYGTSALDAWDPEGDGQPAIAFSPGEAGWAEVNVFTLASSVDGTTLWRIPSGDYGPYQGLDVGRVGGGTRMVYPVREGDWGDGAWVEVEALTGQLLWRSPAPSLPDTPFQSITPIDTVYSPAGPNGTLVLAGRAWSAVDSRLIALDAQTHAVRWMLDGTMLPALERDIVAIAAVDLGGPPMIAACLNDNTSSRILLVDAESGAPGWLSVSMSTADGECGVMAGRFPDSGNSLVVAVINDSLRAYDAVTHTLAWFLQVPADGASLLEQGASGGEIVVFQGTHLRFFDVATRTELRSFDLGLPVTAVHQVRGDIRGLLVAAGGHLLVVDGISGVIRHATDYLGNDLGKGNRIATADLGGGYARVGIGSDDGVVRFRLYSGDGVFDDGFEAVVD